MLKSLLVGVAMLAVPSACGGDTADSTTQQPSSTTNAIVLTTDITAQSSCNGTPVSCSRFTPYSCDQQEGCQIRQSGARVTCSGRPMSCRSFYDADSCEQQQGCRWYDDRNSGSEGDDDGNYPGGGRYPPEAPAP